MHELSVTQSLLELAQDHARGGQITDLYIVVGQLSSFIDDSVQFYWNVISEGTLAEGSTLHFNRKTAVMECRECQHQYQFNAEQFACPNCGSVQIQLISGDEFYLEAIEVVPMEQIPS
ncbi:MAG: hydrogenase maturation nickel metallochaperone HypA [Anaerolineae bacterium]